MPRKKKFNYWASFKENYPLCLGHGLVVFLSSFLFLIYYGASRGFIEEISDPYGKVLALCVLMVTFLKLINWIGFDIFNKFAESIQDAFTRGYTEKK